MPSSQNTTVLTIWSSTFKRQILQVKKKQPFIEKLRYLFFVFFLLCFTIKLTFLNFHKLKMGMVCRQLRDRTFTVYFILNKLCKLTSMTIN